MISENAAQILSFLQANPSVDVTAKDLANKFGMTDRQVNGVITAGLQRKGWTVREEAAVEIDGEPTKVKFIKLTSAGAALDIAAENAESAE